MEMGPGPKEFETMRFFGILHQTFKTMSSNKKIFTQITLAFIFPLSLVMLSYMHTLEFLFSEIFSNDKAFYDYLSHLAALENPLDCFNLQSIATFKALISCVSYQYIVAGLVNVPYLLSVFILSLLSSSAVAYSVGCLYAGIDLDFTKVVHVVLRIWQKLLIKHTWMMLYHNIVVLYLLFLYIMSFWNFYTETWEWTCLFLQLCVAAMFLVSNFSAVMNFEWHLLGVLSILEGTEAGEEISILTSTKCGFARSVAVMLHLSTLATEVKYYWLIVHGNSFGYAGKVGCGSVCFLLVSASILVGLVTQTNLYFLCKTWNHETFEATRIQSILRGYLEDDLHQNNKGVPPKSVV